MKKYRIEKNMEKAAKLAEKIMSEISRPAKHCLRFRKFCMLSDPPAACRDCKYFNALSFMRVEAKDKRRGK
jgi:hypothetical protein